MEEERIPWERRGELGIARAFWDTLVLAARHPTRFFAIQPRDASPIAAITFGLVFEVFIAVLTFIYEKAVGEAELKETLARFTPELRQVLPRGPELVEQLVSGSALGSLLVTPVSYVVELLATTAVTWIGLRLTKNLRTPFWVLVRVFAYASWVRVFAVLGVTGDMILSTLGGVLSFGFGSYAWLVAVKQTQGITTTRAVYASLLGGLVAMSLGCIFGLPPLIALVVYAVSKVELPTLAP